MASSILVRFLGGQPEVFATASPAERQRVLDIVRSVEPLSQRYRGINVDSTPDLHEPPLERISAPTLIVSARDDLFNTLPAAQYAADRIPGARLAVYDTGGHLLVGRGAAVRAEAKTFIDSAGAGRVGADHRSRTSPQARARLVDPAELIRSDANHGSLARNVDFN
ncbi:MAG: alpha/beta hydrolase [Phenylobacterium sp.]|uniref:alpha/beta fold hydrolase n=1 Tax=Phenylobacterium sp. TaxID=1871053 RepID=UPI002736B1F0|nr:alpha/beta hydrolase [Phenylobacterium sp.]MDP3748106.1 alpha/beta hydrolase [Phenylobacterium sp.]